MAHFWQVGSPVLIGLLLLSSLSVEMGDHQGVTDEELSHIERTVQHSIDEHPRAPERGRLLAEVRRESWKIVLDLTLLDAAGHSGPHTRVALTRSRGAWPALVSAGLDELLSKTPPRPERKLVPPTELAEDDGPNLVPWFVMGGSIAAATVGAVYAIKTADTLSNLPIPPPGRSLTAEEALDIKSGQESAFQTGIAANVLLSVGTAGMLTSLLLLASGV